MGICSFSDRPGYPDEQLADGCLPEAGGPGGDGRGWVSRTNLQSGLWFPQIYS